MTTTGAATCNNVCESKQVLKVLGIAHLLLPLCGSHYCKGNHDHEAAMHLWNSKVVLHADDTEHYLLSVEWLSNLLV